MSRYTKEEAIALCRPQRVCLGRGMTKQRSMCFVPLDYTSRQNFNISSHDNNTHSSTRSNTHGNKRSTSTRHNPIPSTKQNLNHRGNLQHGQYGWCQPSSSMRPQTLQGR